MHHRRHPGRIRIPDTAGRRTIAIKSLHPANNREDSAYRPFRRIRMGNRRIQRSAGRCHFSGNRTAVKRHRLPSAPIHRKECHWRPPVLQFQHTPAGRRQVTGALTQRHFQHGVYGGTCRQAALPSPYTSHQATLCRAPE